MRRSLHFTLPYSRQLRPGRREHALRLRPDQPNVDHVVPVARTPRADRRERRRASSRTAAWSAGVRRSSVGFEEW